MKSKQTTSPEVCTEDVNKPSPPLQQSHASDRRARETRLHQTRARSNGTLRCMICVSRVLRWKLGIALRRRTGILVETSEIWDASGMSGCNPRNREKRLDRKRVLQRPLAVPITRETNGRAQDRGSIQRRMARQLLREVQERTGALQPTHILLLNIFIRTATKRRGKGNGSGTQRDNESTAG